MSCNTGLVYVWEPLDFQLLHVWKSLCFLEDIFTGYTILDWQFFLLSVWRYASLSSHVDFLLMKKLLSFLSLFLYMQWVIFLQMLWRFSLFTDFEWFWCSFLHVSWYWGSLNCSDLWIYSFHQIWKGCGHHLLKYFFCPSPFFQNSKTHMLGHLKLSHGSLILSVSKILCSVSLPFLPVN